VTHRAVRLIAAAAAAVCLQAAGARDNNLQILQTRDHVRLISEMIHDARVVPLDGRPHAPASVRSWTCSYDGQVERRDRRVRLSRR